MRQNQIAKKALFKKIILIVLVAGIGLFVYFRVDALKKQARSFIEATFRQKMHLGVKFGAIRSYLLGYVTFRNIEIEDGVGSGSGQLVFSAKEVSVRYRLLDLITKNSGRSKLTLEIKNPKVYWRPHVGVSIKRPDFPFIDWMRQWAVTQTQNLEVKIENLELILPSTGKSIQGINLTVKNHHFELEVPLRHLEFVGTDVSSVLKANGEFELGFLGQKDELSGRFTTEGTIINWMPVTQEASADFVFSKDGLSINSLQIFGGIHAEGVVDFEDDYNIHFTLSTENYPINNLAPFFKSHAGTKLPGRVDCQLQLRGNPLSPSYECRMRLYDGWTKRKAFKALDLGFDGVYPTAKLKNSRMLLEDGTSMHFANEALEVWDIFKEETLERLASEAQQDSAVWGTWEFKRPKEISGTQEDDNFLVRNHMGKNISLDLKKINEPEVYEPKSEIEPIEVGLSYRLKSDDSLKIGVREDEKFVGIERKTRF